MHFSAANVFVFKKGNMLGLFLTQVGLHLCEDLKIPFIKCMAAWPYSRRETPLTRSMKYMYTTCVVFWLVCLFVFNIWMPSCFSNTFNTILGLLKYLKEFLKRHWILPQLITCMSYQRIVHATYAVKFYVLQGYSIFNALSVAKSVCRGVVKLKSHQWNFKAAYW